MSVEKKVRPIFDPAWAGGDDALVWITTYAVAAPRPTEVPWFGELGEVRIVFYFGTFEYTEPIYSEVNFTDRLNVRVEAATRQLPEGLYLMILIPHGNENSPGSESRARSQASTVAGLVGAVCGVNTIYRRVFENIRHLGTHRISAFGPALRNPRRWGTADVNPKKMQDLGAAYDALQKLSEKERNRVELAMHWFEEAYASEGMDHFVRLWVALEALGMSERQNIAPLNDVLARAYAITATEAQDRFGLGRIFGFRSKILHRGARPPINGGLIWYLSAIFLDVLYERLGLPSPRAAQEAQDTEEWNLKLWLQR